MGFLSKFEGKMEDTVEGAAEKMGSSPLSPVQIAKKAERQMRRGKMVGAGKQYAPTLYTVLVSQDDDARLFGYYPTLAGETETYLAAKAAEHGLVMDGQPLVRFIADDGLKHGKFDIIAEMVAAPIVAQLREEEMERYGIQTPASARRSPRRGVERPQAPARAAGPRNGAGYNEAPAYEPLPRDGQADGFAGEPQTMRIDATNVDAQPETSADLQAYIYDATNDRAFTLTGNPMLIGRESKCDIVIPDINVSRSHAEIRMEPTGAWVLSDQGSTNGTYVNGRRIKSAPLKDADRIIVGTTELEFQLI